jgi:hypothetical protein
MLFEDIVAVCPENHTKPIITLCMQNAVIKAGSTYSYHWFNRICFSGSAFNFKMLTLNL